MRHILLQFVLMVFGLTVAYAAPSQNNQSPVGYWKTIDDVTGKPKSIMQISEQSDGSLNGRIVKIWPKPGKDINEVCEACEGEKHNQRIVGMVILTGLKQGETQWEGGEILDPSTGKTYHCNMRVVDNGAKLNVHGYIGFSLLGRTQTWLRVGSASAR
ncbi:MAG: DUF2147 domain-containing protein [Gammaproteobacteria bacterium]|nr:DUF2147 domain-containing protein [Gammaproteobacteria bacterium]